MSQRLGTSNLQIAPREFRSPPGRYKPHVVHLLNSKHRRCQAETNGRFPVCANELETAALNLEVGIAIVAHFTWTLHQHPPRPQMISRKT